MYDWATFLGEQCRKVPKMKSYHHFIFAPSTPGVVTLKEFSDSKSSTYRILTDDSWSPTADKLPPVIPPSGLSAQRQWYLYKEIREFCRAGTKDLVCPLPATPLEEQVVKSEPETEEEVTEEPEPRPAKRPKRCGLCGTPGHTRRTCSHEQW